MKSKNQIYSKEEIAFIDRHNSDTIFFLEVICGTIIAVVFFRAISRILVAFYSRSILIIKPNYRKAILTKETGHLLGQRKDVA